MAVLERALKAGLTAHLGCASERTDRGGPPNYRNGTITKRVQTGVGPTSLAVPRDWARTLAPLPAPTLHAH